MYTGEGPLLRVQPVTPPRAGIHRQGICHEEPYALRSLDRRVDTCVFVWSGRCVGYVGWVCESEHVCCVLCAVVCAKAELRSVVCCVCVVVMLACCTRQCASWGWGQ